MAEPAVSFYVEVDEFKILFDAGYSSIVVENAKKMNIDLSQTTHIILSHGHNDHTRGLQYLNQCLDLKKVKLIAHPHCFREKQNEGLNISAPFSNQEIAQITNYIPTTKPFYLSDNCVFLGEIPVTQAFEKRYAVGMQKNDNNLWEEDYLLDDSALVLSTEEGLFIISGCSHSGICNIIDYAKYLFPHKKIKGVLGGFHLFEYNARTEKTLDYLKHCQIQTIYPCHCISLKVKSEMAQQLPIEEVGVSLEIVL